MHTGGTSCPLTGLQLQGTVVLRLDEERRTQIYAWLAEQGVDVAHIIMEVAQKWHAQGSDGESVFIYCLKHNVTWTQPIQPLCPSQHERLSSCSSLS